MLFCFCEDLSSRQIHTTGPAGLWENTYELGKDCQKALHISYIILDSYQQGVNTYFLNFCYFDS